MLQLLSFTHFLDENNGIVFWNLLLFFGKYLLFLDFLTCSLIDFRLDFSRFWPFTATSRITTTAPKLLYLKVFSETCGSVAVIFKKQNFCTGQILLQCSDGRMTYEWTGQMVRDLCFANISLSFLCSFHNHLYFCKVTLRTMTSHGLLKGDKHRGKLKAQFRL